MKLRPTVLLAATLIGAMAALGTHIRNSRGSSPRDSDTTLTEPPQDTPDHIACWVEKACGQAIQQRPEANACSD